MEEQVVSRTQGHRLLGGVSGFAVGLGVAILLHQFAVVPLNVWLLALPVGVMLIGVALGRPRVRTAAPVGTGGAATNSPAPSAPTSPPPPPPHDGPAPPAGT